MAELIEMRNGELAADSYLQCRPEWVSERVARGEKIGCERGEESGKSYAVPTSNNPLFHCDANFFW
ncbi:hypothetical protein ANCDUO_08240 [Ancylostoma duodenale]|uniref:Uncharacterized protein n=1 Tax=Ancylostoma duodenale TaxID=51022 RepID=A0A0C2GWJ5_9BILA|nr:hypothetical protein ANCDUO_08240 [Ancylostoma duodenale]